MTAPLAEVAEEGRRLLTDAARHTDGDLRNGRGALRLLPRLLAVAEAAVEMRASLAGHEPPSCADEIAAFDAAARGERG